MSASRGDVRKRCQRHQYARTVASASLKVGARLGWRPFRRVTSSSHFVSGRASRRALLYALSRVSTLAGALAVERNEQWLDRRYVGAVSPAHTAEEAADARPLQHPEAIYVRFCT
jgi:hypothetical protein